MNKEKESIAKEQTTKHEKKEDQKANQLLSNVHTIEVDK